MRLRPATEADILAFTGRRVTWPIMAYAVLVEGVVMGIGGVAKREDGTGLGFCNCRPEFMPSAIVATRIGIRIMRTATEHGLSRITACPDPSLANARRWLRLIGFAPSGDDDGVWEWQA